MIMDKTMQALEKGRQAFLNGEFADAAERFKGVLQTQALSESIRIEALTGQLDALLELGELDRVWDLLQRYLQESDRPERRERKAALLHIYAKYLFLRKDLKAAIEVSREELSFISSQHKRYYLRLTENYLQQARIFLHLNDLTEARIYLDLATYYMQTDGDELLKAYYYYYEASYLLAKKKKTEAEQFFLSARDLFLFSGALWWAEKVDKKLTHKDE